MFRDPLNPKAIDFATLSRHAPARAGDLAYKVFCTPHLSTRRSPDHDVLAARARYHLRDAKNCTIQVPNHHTLKAYVFEPETTPALDTILIVHGWTSEASFMTAIAEPLRRSGFRVILFDCPAHGRSGGRQTSLIDCAKATVFVTKFFEHQLGPICSVIAHSMGGLASLLAATGGEPLSASTDFSRFILISSPNKFSEVTGDFSKDVDLLPKAQRAYEHHLERIAHRRLQDFTAAKMLSKRNAPALLIHARDDDEVPIHNAREITRSCPKTELLEFDHLGHRNILYAPQVIRAILNELKSQPKAQLSVARQKTLQISKAGETTKPIDKSSPTNALAGPHQTPK